jgi:hypothetical protein
MTLVSRSLHYMKTTSDTDDIGIIDMHRFFWPLPQYKTCNAELYDFWLFYLNYFHISQNAKNKWETKNTTPPEQFQKHSKKSQTQTISTLQTDTGNINTPNTEIHIYMSPKFPGLLQTLQEKVVELS